MKAAVVRSFDAPPRYEDFAEPALKSRSEMLVDVLAVGLHPPRCAREPVARTTRATASCRWFQASTGLVAAATESCATSCSTTGSRARWPDKTVIDVDRSLVLPRDVDPIAIAAGLNPAMGFVARRCAVVLRSRSDKRCSFSAPPAMPAAWRCRSLVTWARPRLWGAGRSEDKLAKLGALGATEVVTFDDAKLGTIARDVDVVLDFVWGDTTAKAMVDVLTARSDRAQPLTWIQIGSVTSPTAAIPSAALRAARLQIIGSGTRLGAGPRHRRGAAVAGEGARTRDIPRRRQADAARVGGASVARRPSHERTHRADAVMQRARRCERWQ